MTMLRSNWHRILAVLVGPAAALMITAVTYADDVFPG